MNISPSVGIWANFLALILTGVGAGAIQWGSLSPDAIGTIKTIAADSLFVLTTGNLVFHLYSAPAAGPMAKGN